MIFRKDFITTFLLLIGHVTCWTQYNTETLYVEITADSNINAAATCARMEGTLVEPIMANVENDIISAVAPFYPVVTFWTGLSRNENATDWLAQNYHVKSEMFLWRVNTTSQDPGECLAMDVWDYGIRVFPEDCATIYPFICQKPEETRNFTLAYENVFSIPIFHDVKLLMTASNCELLCNTQPWCTGYQHIVGPDECRLLNMSSIAMVNSTEEVIVCNLVNVTVCDPLNDTYSYVNCTANNGTNIESCVSVIPTPFIFVYQKPTGSCVSLVSPTSGNLDLNTLNFECSDKDEATLSVNLTCNEDLRWNTLPKCRLDTGTCPMGYEQFRGICYYLGPSTAYWSELETLCSAVGGNPLHVHQNQEMQFLGKWLQHKTISNIWSGGTYKYMEEGARASSWIISYPYYWIHSYELLDYTNWPGKEPMPTRHECISFNRNGSDLLFAFETCNQKKNYVCTTGSSTLYGQYCDSDAWCRGNGKCIYSYYYGRATCRCSGIRNVLVGGTDDPSSYCEKELSVTSDSHWWTVRSGFQWTVAVAACKSFGGSIYTPLDTTEETRAKSKYYTTGYGGMYWTSLHIQNSTLQQKGIGYYNVTRHRSLPLKSILDLSSEDECLYMIISELGVRLYNVSCSSRKGFICKKEIGGYGMVDSDNTGSVMETIVSVDSAEICELECLYNRRCMAYTFSTITFDCYLYDNTFTGTNTDPSTIEKSKLVKSCSTPSPPHNGVIDSQTSIQFTYSCYPPYVVADDASHTIDCQDNGQWSDVPSCIRGDFRCPQDYEQLGLVCFYVSYNDAMRKWESARDRCLAKEAALAEIESAAEMDFLSIVLSYSSTALYWIGATDSIVNSYYTWSSSIYTEITYKDWFTGPSNDDNEEAGTNCVSLSRYHNKTDQGRVYYEDEICTRYNYYVCSKRLFNVGETGCTAYGEFSCKIHSSCITDKCICKSGFLQIGADGLNTTYCKEILPIGAQGCLGLDDLCLNRSICTTDKCSCPAGTSQNGPDYSYSTSCFDGDLPCDNEWTYLNERCFKLLTGVTNGISIVYEGYFHCGKETSYPAVIHDQETNDFIMTLGSVRSKRFIGLRDLNENQDYYWSDGSSLDFMNLLPVESFNTSAGLLCAYMNQAGYWEKATCANIDVAPDVACEKPTNCPSWPDVDHAVTPTGSISVGDGDFYICQEGYALSGVHTGYVECLFDGLTSQWSPLPECKALGEEVFKTWPYAVLYGASFYSQPKANLSCCMIECHSSAACVGGCYDGTTCTLYTQMSENNIALDYQTDQSPEVYVKQACDSPKRVEHASITGTGRLIGDSIMYHCKPHHRVNRISPAKLTCQTDMKWDSPSPSCQSRFQRRTGETIYSGDGMTKIKVYHAVLSADECERRCVTETKQRCMFAVWIHGSCTLFDKPAEQRAIAYEPMHRPFSDSLSVISTLIDSDLENFDLHYDYDISSGSVLQFIGNHSSYEICAQTCSNMDECTAFNYNSLASEDETKASCTLYSGTITMNANTDSKNPEVFVKKFVCSNPPLVTNAVLYDVIRQSPGVYSIGDKVAVSCTVFGEQIIGNHPAVIECLPTGFWSSAPVCSNLCDTDWCMLNGSCYKIFDTPSTFWEAYEGCHTVHAGLVNMNSSDELSRLHDIWNITGKISSTFWLGVYEDLGRWHWSEKLGGTITEILPSLGPAGGGMAVSLQMDTLVYSASDIYRINSYICKKAAANLVCPNGWDGYKDKCYKIQTAAASFSNAENDCISLGGNLASLHSWWQKDIVTEMVYNALGSSDQAFVGLHNEPGKNFKWTDGSVVDFMFQKPFHFSTSEKCGVVSRQSDTDYKFETVDCASVSKPYVCQTYLYHVGLPTDVSTLPCSTDSFCALNGLKCIGFQLPDAFFAPSCRPFDCPAPYEYIDGGCYYFSGEKTGSYAKGLSKCNSAEGHLLTIDSMKENYIVTERHIKIQSENGDVSSILLGYDKILAAEYTAADTRTLPHLQYFESLSSLVVGIDTFMKAGYWTVLRKVSFIVCKITLGISPADPFYEGCYADVTTTWDKDLPEAIFTDTTLMTVSHCVNHCHSLGFKYAGLQDGSSCACGNSRGRHGRLLSSTCNVACSGNSSQICGGTQANSVYRVTGNPCAKSMVRNPIDPLMCYSMTNKPLVQMDAMIDCALQGGILIEPKSPELEETIYNQLLLTSYRNGNSTPPTTWLGLASHTYWYSDIHEKADWVLYNSYPSNIYTFPGSIAYIYLHDGKWDSRTMGTNSFPHVIEYDESAYSCQFISTMDTLQGLNLNRKFDGKDTYILSSSGQTRLDSKFDSKCLYDLSRCPFGYTLRFWLTIHQSTESFVIFQTGNCASNTLGDDGLCIFFETASELVNIVYKVNETVLQAAFPAFVNINTTVVIFVQDIQNIFLYIDENYFGKLKDLSFIYLSAQKILHPIPLLYNTDTTKFTMNDITFNPGPIDEHTLSQLHEENNRVEQSSTVFFQMYNNKTSASEGRGIDGNGIKVVSVVRGMDLNIRSGSDLEIGFWLRVQNGKSDRHQSENIFTILDPTDTKDSFLMISYLPDLSIHRIVMHDIYSFTGQHFSCDVPVTVGRWHHIALTLHSNSLSVYLDGSTIPVTLTSTSAGLTTNVNTSVHYGSARCPIAFASHGISCYSTRLVSLPANSSSNTPGYWDHAGVCEKYGGYIVVPNDLEEEIFILNYLSARNAPVQIGIYDGLAGNEQRQWFTADGYRLSYLPDIQSANTSGYYTYYNLGGIMTEADYKADYVLCETNLGDEKTRVQKKLLCPPGWSYWNLNCYMKGTSVTTASDAMAFCSIHRSILVEINSKEEQQFITGLIQSNSSSQVVYIGATLDVQNKSTFYRWGNMRPTDFSYVEVNHVPSPSKACVTVDCTDERSCPWKSVDCSTQLNPVCEKPANFHCVPTWFSFKTKCITIYTATFPVSKALCTDQSSRPVTFLSNVEMEEFVLVNYLGTEDCLTDAVLNSDGSYTWLSLNNTPTYFNGKSITGSDICIGVSPDGQLVRKSCSAFTCIICEYSTKNVIEIDNVHVLDSSPTNEILTKYVEESFNEIVYTWEFDDTTPGSLLSFAGNRSDNKQITFTTSTGLFLQNDGILGRVLQIERSFGGLVYSLAQDDYCLLDTVHCPRGISVEFYVNELNTSDCTIVNTKTDGTTGLVIWLDSSTCSQVSDEAQCATCLFRNTFTILITRESKLYVSVNEMHYQWTTWMWLTKEEWIHVAVTWHRHFGITMYTNYWKVHNTREYHPVDPAIYSTPSTEVIVGKCQNESSNLRLDDIIIRDYMMEESDYAALRYGKEKTTFTIDFNYPVSWSKTNLVHSFNESLATYVWRNSIFHTACRINNPDGDVPAIIIPQQTMHCFTCSDACGGPFTLSLWLNPRDMESDQIFYHTGTPVGSQFTTTSLKIWYNSYTDQYLFEAMYDKANFTIDFYIYLYEWSHLVLTADFDNEQLTLYVNQQQIGTITATLQAERIIPRYPLSFLKIGELGTFYIDDIQYSPGIKHVSEFYVLESCEEYSIAGFHGIQNVTIDRNRKDNDTATSVVTCDFTIEWTGYSLSFDDMTVNSTFPTNATITVYNGDPEYVEGVRNNATRFNGSGIAISDLSPNCLGNIQNCFFGLTIGLWIRIDEIDPSTNFITILEMGGNLNQNQSGVSFVCKNMSNSDTLQCDYTIVYNSEMWNVGFTLLSKTWSHIAMTWNPSKSLYIYINGHSLMEFGVEANYLNISSSEICDSNNNSTILIGASSFVQGQKGVLLVDDGYLMDSFLSEMNVRMIYGQRRKCLMDWYYNSLTDMCYKHSSDTKSHVHAEAVCQEHGGNLAYIQDIHFNNWLGTKLNEELVTSSLWIGLKQLPRSSFPIRWSNGERPIFNTGPINHSGLNQNNRYCGYFAMQSSNSWGWEVGLCTDARLYLCQMRPLYLATDVRFSFTSDVRYPLIYLNSSNTEDNQDFIIDAQMSYTRGVTKQALVFNKTMIFMDKADSCITNFGFCHNGMKIEFWLLLDELVLDNSRQVIMSSQSGSFTYGLTIYMFNDTSGIQLGIDYLTESNYTMTSLPITSQAWTHVSVSFSNTTTLTIYLNGIQTSFKSIEYNSTVNDTRILGEKVQVSAGSNNLLTEYVNMKIDNMTIDEVLVTDPIQLHSDVYLNAPVFHLPFDNWKLLSPGIQSEGWIGPSAKLNMTHPGPLSFTGQFAYDCLGSPDYCLEGFSFSLWFKPASIITDNVVLAALNSNRGFAFVYYTSYLSKSNHYWIFVRNDALEVNLPLDVVPNVWSFVSFTWYINGTVHAMLNGDPVLYTEATTSSIASTNEQPVVELEFSPLVDPNLAAVSTFEGEIDEFIFYRRPLPSDVLLDLYKNITFTRHPSYWSFDDLPNKFNGNSDNMTIKDGSVGNATQITSGKEWLNITGELNGTNCLLDIDNCVHGFTLHLNLRLITEEDSDQFIMTTGAHDSSNLGIALMFTAMNKSLPFRRYFEAAVLTTEHEYRTWFNIEYSIWTHVTITWHNIMGIKVLIDGVQAAENRTGAARTLPSGTKQELFVGRYPDIGFDRGTFEIDEMHFLDRSTFEEILNAGEMWHHWPHKLHVTDNNARADEITLDECYNLCEETENCQDFSFCDNFRYGNCFYSNTSSNTTSQTAQNCDMFVQVQIGIDVQIAGCLDQADASAFVNYGVMSSASNCHSQCKNDTFVYAMFSGSLICYCAGPELSNIMTRPDSRINFICNTNEEEVWQVQGFRDFLNVTTHITELNVYFYPGNTLLFNQTLNISLATTEFSFAGFGIDPGNGSDMFYTGRNETSVLYEFPGQYILTIYALNEISTMVYAANIFVTTSIEAVLISLPSLTATFKNFESNVTVIGGLYITCNISFGDGVSDSLFIENATEPLLFNHTYNDEGDHHVNITCYNGVSEAFNSSFITAMHPVINFTVLGPSAVIYGSDIQITYFSDLGRDVTAEIYLDGHLYNLSYVEGSLHNESLIITFSMYQTLGIHTVNITVSNQVTVPFSEILSVMVDKRIELNSNSTCLGKKYFLVNEMVNLTFGFLFGSNVNITADFVVAEHEYFYAGDVSFHDFSVAHSISVPGNYYIAVELENSVSAIVLLNEVYVDISLDNLTFSVQEPVPGVFIDPVQFIISLPSHTPSPYNSYVLFDYGDGNSVTADLVFLNGTFIMNYNYTVLDNFNVTITAFNNMSSLTWNYPLQLLKPVMNLTVIPNALGLNVDDNLNLKINISGGFYVTYYIVISDIIEVEHTSPVQLSTPFAAYEFNHIFNTPGEYEVEIVANNSISSERANFTVFIVEPPLVVLVGDNIGQVMETLNFHLVIVKYGSIPCFLFDFGDDHKKLYGSKACALQSQFAGIPISVHENTNTISTSHRYNDSGKFQMSVRTTNPKSDDVHHLTVRILQYPCDIPEIEIYGFSKNESEPSKVRTSSELYMKTYTNTYCIPFRNAMFKWSITSLDHIHVNYTSFQPQTLPFLIIPAGYLQYGLYRIKVSVYIEGYPEYNNTCSIFLKVVPSQLELSIVGDFDRSVRSGSSLIMNASTSYDPDFQIHKVPFNFTWYCWAGAVTFDYALHKDSPDLKNIGSVGCFQGIDTDNGSNPVLSIDSGYIIEGIQLMFVAVMQHWERIKWKTQDVLVKGITDTELAIRCYENCGDTVSPDAIIRVKGECVSCIPHQRLSVQYQWRLYNVTDTGTARVDNLAQFTTTGTDGPNLVIRGGLLKPGASYEIRFYSGAGYTYRKLYANMPPYNGTCGSNTDIGMAFKTKFIFKCNGWLDEGDRGHQDFTMDKVRRELLKYTFYYRIIEEETLVPFLQLYGIELTTPEVLLPPGFESFNITVDVMIKIEDRYRGYTMYKLSLTVLENLESTDSLLRGIEMNTCAADRDMMCMLLMDRAIFDIAKGNNTIKKEVSANDQVLVDVLRNLDEFSSIIQDPLQLEQAALLLERMGHSNARDMSKDIQDSISDVFVNLVSSAENDLRNKMTSEERQRAAKALLLWLIRFAQDTKYNQSCQSDNCQEKLQIGERAIDIYSITHNITSLLLEETLPGEEPVLIHLEEGNTYMKVECVDVLTVSNKSLEINGYGMARIPDISSYLDPSLLEEIFLETILSDNLYTTDETARQVKSRAVSISFVLERGETIKIKDLSTPVEIKFLVPRLSNLPTSTIDLSSKAPDVPYFVEVMINETGVTPYIVITPQDDRAVVGYIIGINSVPSNTSYDDTGELSLQNGASNETFILHNIKLRSLEKTKNETAHVIYIGFLPNFNISSISPLVNFSTFAFDCSYWSDKKRKWAKNGISLGRINLPSSETLCLSSHLTSFGANIFVPPNTIDFTTAFSKFSTDNLAVICTVASLICLYFLLILWTRRMDKTDQLKWEILPLKDNLPCDVYHYHVTVYTGVRKGAGTTSKVFFVLGGESENSEIRMLEDLESRPLSTGSVNNYIVSVPCGLNCLQYLTIWHDTTGKGEDADWYLNMVIVRDIQTGQRYIFLCDMWLSVDKGDGQVERVLPVASDEEIQAFGHLFFTQTRKDLTDGHLWISVLARPMYSNFSRVQRLSCCLSLLFLTMITNAMWYMSDGGENQQNVSLGPFTFSAQEFSVSILGSLIVVPVNLLIITLFRKSRPKRLNKDKVKTKYKSHGKDQKKKTESDSVNERRLASYLADNWVGDYETNVINEEKENNDIGKKDKKKTKKRRALPHWCVYIAWILVILSVVSSGFFVILYSNEWGPTKSSKWLTSFFLSFFESVILIQPLKVVVVAIVFAILFKTIDEDENEIIETFKAETRHGVRYTEATYPAHRIQYTESPISDKVVFEAREHRKKMNKLFEVLREIIIYLIYLIVVAVLSYENMDPNSFRTFTTITDRFVFPSTIKDKNFINVSSVNSFWDWTHESLVPNLHPGFLYNGSTSTDLGDMIADNTHYLMGRARLRQARIAKDPTKCKVSDMVKPIMTVCEPDYKISTHDDRDYFPGWIESSNSTDTPWKYQDTFILDGLPMMGRYATYGGGGYVASLGNTIEGAHELLYSLQNDSWIDSYTRAVIVEFNLYNPNINLFTVVTLMAELPATGGVIPWPQINTLILYRYQGASAIFVLAFDIIFVIFTLFYTYDIYQRIRSQKRAFLFAAWNYVDFANICMSITLCALYGVHFLEAKFTLSDFREHKEAYINLNHLLMWDQIYHHVLSFLLFSSMLKLLQLIRFNTKIAQLSSTLVKARGPIVSFFVVFTGIIMAFSSAGYMIFGRADPQYKSFFDSIETLMSMLMMKVDINNMLQVNGALGYIYLFLFVLLIVFILINMLLSILNDAFTEVREDPKLRAEDPKVVDFLIEQLKKLIFSDHSKAEVRSSGMEQDLFDSVEKKIHTIDQRLNTVLDQNYKDKI